MSEPHRQRSTRSRPAKPALSEDAVVEAALSILRTEGLHAVSMRRVASALDTGAASLYVYVSGRDGLLQAMQARILGAIELDRPDPARWREQLQGLLARTRQALLAHPGIATTMMAVPPTSDAALALQENLLETLVAGGIQLQQAAWVSDIVAALVTNSVLEAERRSVDRRQLVDDLRARFAALPPERFPLLVTHAATLVSGNEDERLRFAVDIVLDGALARQRPAS